MIEKATSLFEDYNKLVEHTFDELVACLSEDNLFRLNDNMLSEALSVKEAIWQSEEKEYLDGSTPEQFFSSIQEPDTLLDLFEQAALLCDRNIPDVLADILAKSEEKVEERLLDIANDEEFRSDQENIVIAAAAIYVLGRTHKAEVLESLIKILMDCNEEDALIMESITSAITQYGNSALDFICSFIQKQERIDFRIEYLVMILPQLSKERKTEDIYKLIKNSFLRMDNKILGASALAEYGDGRAVPALRGFLEKNTNMLDRETFYEIKKSIEMLGGSIDGISIPDFNNENRVIH